MATGKLFNAFFVVKINTKRNSFQYCKKESIAIVETTGMDNGIIRDQNI